MAEAAPPAPKGFPVAFHFNVGERLPYACRLARKAVARGDRLLMVGPREILDALDPLLWTFSALDFIAHLRVDTGAALPGDWCEATPVLLHEGQYSLTMLAASMGDVRQYTDAVFHDWIEDVAVMSVAARNHFPLSDMVEVANEVEVRLGG